ncbi:GNAT family N-acetyltransferase [Vibrio pectenicida]|uniref:GNAT family N-acetyltransferase n=1 Tax=Vibrio pectenicida TaxID=62763 RepID=A0A7Y4EEU0_9VIBR|nr:GNAT family N-acetyltransferase [Vibrio pectenicida]NOH71718.1 GNAT family N-acetyltransferase [Vibrio pectenicida]
MEYKLDTKPSNRDIDEVRGGLIKHNTPFLQGIPSSQVGYYAVENNEKLGGIIADLWGNWLLIKFLWVDESVRGKRIGGKLLKLMEAYAKANGCKSVLVETFNFQASVFYEKYGYKCQMTLENYPIDSSLLYLTKSLTKSC